MIGFRGHPSNHTILLASLGYSSEDWLDSLTSLVIWGLPRVNTFPRDRRARCASYQLSRHPDRFLRHIEPSYRGARVT
jgi:hypothetical protein